MGAFTQHDVAGPPVVLDTQQAALLELLSAAVAEPVSYEEQQEAGMDIPVRATEAMSPVASPVADELRDRLLRVLRGGADHARAGVTELIAWVVCNGPPIARYGVRWLLRTGRTAGERAHQSTSDSQPTRNRCLALSALVTVAGVVLVLILTNLGA